MGDSARPVLQIVGSVVGAAIGGPLGSAAIGAAIGGGLGNALGAELFPQNVGEGPRLNELRIGGSSYGRPLPLVFGNQNRFAGTVIWYSGLEESRSDREVSKGNEVTEYSYSVSVAIALCEGPIASISKIWANGKILWQGDFFADSVTEATAKELAADANATALEADAAACGTATDPNCADIYARATAARAQADAATAAKNAAIASQSEYQTQFEPWSFTSDLAPGATFRFYPGTMTQEPDSTIDAAKGGEAPAYRGVCYLVIEDLQLADFGNRLPNLEFEVVSGSITVSAALAAIHNKSGISAFDYSTNLSVDDTLAGYTVTRQMTSLQAITQLEQAFFFDTVESYGGQIRHIKRGGMNKATIGAGELGGNSSRNTPSQPVTTVRLNDESLPSAASITYRDAARDYQTNTQRINRSKGASDNIIDLQVAITLDNDYARTVVERMLWEPWVSRLSTKVQAGPSFGWLAAADVIGLPVAGAVHPFRVDRVTEGANGLVEIVARQDDPFIYSGATTAPGGTSTGTAATATLSDQGHAAPALSIVDTEIYVFNAPILGTSEAATAFSYSIDAAADSWRSGTLYRALDGVTFNAVASHSSKNITGDVSAALGTANPALWDRVNTITVILASDSATLTTRTEAEVVAGANAFWLGADDGSRGEVIQFKTATLITASPKTYELSNLLRGRRATEHEIDLHTTDEVFVLLEAAYLRSLDYSAADLNVTRYYKGVSAGQDESTVIPLQSFINTGEKAKPRSPTGIAGSRDGSNNLTVTWYRRIRGYAPPLGNSPLALDEPSENYEIDIIDSSNDVVRTLTATAETVGYTAAQQTTDGFTPGDPISGNVYQISATVGRGYAGSFTV